MSIIPVVLGEGKPMVNNLKQRVHLTLIDTKKFIYEVGKKIKTADKMVLHYGG